MGKLQLVQMMCPARHCLLMTTYAEGDGTPEGAEATLLDMMEIGLASGTCALCGSKQLHFEHGATRWDTLEEAMPHLVEVMQQIAATKQIMEQTGLSLEQLQRVEQTVAGLLVEQEPPSRSRPN